MAKRSADANRKDAVVGVVLFVSLAVIAAFVCAWVVLRDQAPPAAPAPVAVN
ncbi:MAG TPA: hypothetical protein VEC57_11665 [Candidatus Limnocylindrales bacterium]|nr:hypothetical protein [Candidatus Limnocylindrales bacterium]